MDNLNMQGLPAAQPKKSNTGLIIGIVVAVLLCCCCIVVLGGGLYLRSAAGKVSNSIQLTLTALPGSIPSMPDATSMPSSPDATSEPSSPDATSEPSVPGIPADAVPQGGLGDDVQRAQAWGFSVLAVVTSGCNVPVAKDTKIEVTKQPDSAGVWVERWTVACNGSASVPVDVTFTPSSSGVTDVKVVLAK